jgi:hypothetical protein
MRNGIRNVADPPKLLEATRKSESDFQSVWILVDSRCLLLYPTSDATRGRCATRGSGSEDGEAKEMTIEDM